MKMRKFLSVWMWVAICVGMLAALVGCSNSDNTNNTPTNPGGTGEEKTDPNLVIQDPLTNGASVGSAFGGTFTAEGFRVNYDDGEYLAYSTGITGNIRVEFDAKGYETWGGQEKRIIIEVFDTPHEVAWTAGPVWESNALFQLKKVDDQMRLKVGARGSWAPSWPYIGSFAWDAGTTYHWVIKLVNGNAEVTRNGELISSIGSAFQPQASLNIRIGGSWWDKGVGNITYSNVKIYREP